MTSTLLGQLIPLLLLIALGYGVGRWLQVQAHSLAMVAIYVLAPVVNFGAVARLEFQATYLMLPPLLFGLAAAMAVLGHWLGSRAFADNRRNLVAMAAATGNTGYFGTPLVLALFGPEALGVYFLMNFAIALCESTIGYYYGARGHHDIRTSVRKVLTLPANYAVLLGLLFNSASLELPPLFVTWWERFTGAWVVLGMMIIGVALSHAGGWRANARLTGLLFTIRFLIWPACAWALVLLDRVVLGLYTPQVHAMILLIGCVPLAGNVVAFATQLRLRPDEAAAVVLESTAFAVVYIPLVFWLAGLAPG